MAAELQHISGLRELYDTMQTLPTNIEKNIMRAALKEGGKVFEQRILDTIPVKSGKLRSTVKVVMRIEKATGRVYAEIRVGGKGAYYAHMVEFGVAAHLIEPKKKKALSFNGITRETIQHPGFDEKPFMRPAFDEGNAAAIEAARQYIMKRLPREVRKKAKMDARRAIGDIQ